MILSEERIIGNKFRIGVKESESGE